MFIDKKNNPRRPLVTIVIPCYNQGHFLTRALKSINEQDYRPIQVLVIDDGSTEDVCLPEMNFDFELLLIRQKNNGLSSARNLGLEKAKGDWIKFLDADDVLLPNCLSDQVPGFCNNFNIVSVIGFIEENTENGHTISIIPAFGDAVEALFIANIAPIHCYLFPTELIRKTGGFDCTERTRGGCEDYDLMMNLLCENITFITVHAIGVVYYRYRDSMSCNITNMRRTHVSVWVNGVINLLASDFIFTPSQSSSLIAGWLKLLKITPNEFKTPLLELGDVISKLIFEKKIIPEVTEISLLKTKLSNFPEADGLLKAINLLYPLGYPSTFHIRDQAILDRRIFLSDSAKPFDEQWLCQVFSMIKNNSMSFAIYGGGEIGKRLFKLIDAVGLTPVCFIDKSFESMNCISDIPVLSLQTAKEMNIRLIVIASARYYQEISELLMKELSNTLII
ncbi:glycosyltransferase family 2 protein [Rheinheimera sp. UJ51]|uniref:glycosyltransferase family 2 protein n=1 Tax=Rheinheimera sp. UJ51 TaxID=2892446 RepID=UPI001E5634A1|nr:glycosyltransferase family A protein [Rheinheimera sp. UJ51]MCC5450493.1 glycosyltransferase family 2 protein [Rheinheimera sp. UJ51]